MSLCILIAPTDEEVAILAHTISHWAARFLVLQGALESDEEHSYLLLGELDKAQSSEEVRGRRDYFLTNTQHGGGSITAKKKPLTQGL